MSLFNMALLYLQPPTQNMGMSGGMNQSGAPPQPPHGHSMPSDGPPSGPHMQTQMNGQMPGKSDKILIIMVYHADSMQCKRARLLISPYSTVTSC